MRSPWRFLAGLSLAVPAWWIGMHLHPEFRSAFVGTADWESFRAFLLPDLVLAAILAGGAWQLRRTPGRADLVTLACGAWVYATACSLAWTIWRGATLLGSALMLLALAGLVASLLARRAETGPLIPDP